MLARNPSSFTPFPDGRYLMLGPDAEMTRSEIAQVQQARRRAVPAEYEAMLERVRPTHRADARPDAARSAAAPARRPVDTAASSGDRFRQLGTRLGEAVEILTGAARPILDRWFESEELKATLATDAIIGAMAPPSMPGTAYVLFHHVMGEAERQARRVGLRARRHGRHHAGARRGRARPRRRDPHRGRGGPHSRARRAGRRRRARTGDEFHAPIVASNADANVTFLKLLDRSALPEAFVAAVERIDYASASLKINVALCELPNFTALPGAEPGPQHRGTIHLCPDQDYIERAYDDAKYGRPSADPMLECTFPSVVDPTVAPPGKHLMSMFIQYAPYKLRDGTWDDQRDAFADRCFDILERVRAELQERR